MHRHNICWVYACIRRVKYAPSIPALLSNAQYISLLRSSNTPCSHPSSLIRPRHPNTVLILLWAVRGAYICPTAAGTKPPNTLSKCPKSDTSYIIDHSHTTSQHCPTSSCGPYTVHATAPPLPMPHPPTPFRNFASLIPKHDTDLSSSVPTASLILQHSFDFICLPELQQALRLIRRAVHLRISILAHPRVSLCPNPGLNIHYQRCTGGPTHSLYMIALCNMSTIL